MIQLPGWIGVTGGRALRVEMPLSKEIAGTELEKAQEAQGWRCERGPTRTAIFAVDSFSSFSG
jgi:hypothetical protein